MRYFLLFFLTACTVNLTLNHPINVRVTSSILTYKKDILPIMINKCSMCHNEKLPQLNWMVYNVAYNKRDSIKLRLLNRSMPPAYTAPLLDNERELVLNWINQGAKE